MNASELPVEKSKALTEAEEKEIVKKLLGETDNEESQKIKIPRPAWVSVGASGGSYSPDLTTISTATSLFASSFDKSNLNSVQSAPSNKPGRSGTSYSIGVMLGKQLAKRWLLQTGLSYLSRRVDSESNIITGNGQHLGAFNSASAISSSNAYSSTNPYTVTNTTEFISVPVQVGYILIDRKIGWTVNTGVATDIFLRNTLQDQSGNYSYLSEGENTAFRPVSWSGLANTELSLRLNEHYRFAIVPGLRYSFTNVIKEDAGSSKPLILDIGFWFRYMFK